MLRKETRMRITLAIGLLLAAIGAYLLVTAKNPLARQREGALARQDRIGARTSGIIDLSAAAGLVVLGVFPHATIAASAVIIAGFAVAFVYQSQARRG
ncbi:hypothetical protein HMPREF1868_02085 [Olsenella sp. DNF00959]|nr:hypothetical protein HMPREF1868_02085 [Olsenella sp. DNF00959]